MDHNSVPTLSIRIRPAKYDSLIAEINVCLGREGSLVVSLRSYSSMTTCNASAPIPEIILHSCIEICTTFGRSSEPRRFGQGSDFSPDVVLPQHFRGREQLFFS